jgi:hypothetical protein
MTDKEVMRMALQKMEYMLRNGEWYEPEKTIEALRAALAQHREWVGLTDEDRMLCEQSAKGNYFALCAAVEAKLKEKNNG